MIKQFFNNTAIVATYKRNYSPPQDIFCSNFLKERRTNLSRVYSEVLGQRSKIVNFRNALSRDSSEKYLSVFWIPKRLTCMILFLRISANKGKWSSSFEAKRRSHDHRHYEKVLTSSHTKQACIILLNSEPSITPLRWTRVNRCKLWWVTFISNRKES